MLATCVGTQATAAVAYTPTFGVPGNYDEGTNGKDLGETARHRFMVYNPLANQEGLRQLTFLFVRTRL